MVSGWPKAVAEGWHPVATIGELSRKRPVSATLMGQKLVIFGDSSSAAVMRDRCPHRGAPLSEGRVRQGTIECPYHGWRFNRAGACVEVPGAVTCPEVKAPVLPSRIAGGAVWTTLADTPPPFPALPDAMLDESLDRFWWPLDPSPAGVLDALENHLDPAHPHLLHPWLVRAPGRRRKTVVTVRTGPWGAEASYREDRRNVALLPAMMEGQRKRSIGRLWPPTIGEVRLENARGKFLSIAVAFVPVQEGMTWPMAHFASMRGILPARLKRIALKAFHLPIIRQDRGMLQLQEENRTGEPYASGPLDVLSEAIWKHANGLPCDETERELEMYL